VTDPSNCDCRPKCPAHSTFELVVEETQTCACGAQGVNRWDYSTFWHHLYINEVFEELSESTSEALLVVDESEVETCVELSNVLKTEGRLPEYLRMLWENTRYPTCPKDCKNPDSTKHLTLLSTPKVFILSLIWKDFRPKLLKILQVFSSISCSLSQDSVFATKFSSVFTLKAMILYGSGHYICVIRTKEDTWNKIDDEYSKNIASWKELVNDLVKSWFYPVGLFYEKSLKGRNFDISPQDWISLERKVLNGQKSPTAKNDESEWTCQCGSQNHSLWKVCKDCSRIREGVKGWSCPSCTFINENSEIYCEACGSIKTGQLSECKKCKKLKKTPYDECACSKTCRICGGHKNCRICLTGFECRVCKEFIPKDEVGFCYKCKNRSRDSKCEKCGNALPKKNMICAPCLDLLWKCRRCFKFNFPESFVCDGISCYGKREDVALQGTSRDKRERFKGNCVGCGVKQKEFLMTCLNCKVKSSFENCKFCSVPCRKDLCENCVQETMKCLICHKKYFFHDSGCPYCKLS
jgi:hypothetical protein